MSNETNYSVLFNQLLEVDGPFITVPIARTSLGKILEKTSQPVVDDLRVAETELLADDTLNSTWIRWILANLLSFDGETLREGPPIAHLSHIVGQHGVTLRPTMVLKDPDNETAQPVLLISEWPASQELSTKAGVDRWNASPISRSIELCHALRVPLGLLTNGRSWTLVHAPKDGSTSTVTWDAQLWLEERETLDLFVALLGSQRFFGVEDGSTLVHLLASSSEAKEEVTTTLGRQVRRAVELLVSALSETNRARHGDLLGDIVSEDVYRAAVTVMMRLIFLMSAEERDLLLLGDDIYDSSYAVSTLLDQLEEEIDVDVLFNRYDAWPRLLATFRLIHGGVQHDDRLNLPAYGGRLFDPDRYPFLEGRIHGEPFDFGGVDDRLLKAINNRVILEILRSLQYVRLDKFKEVRRLSFRHLDVEQIGTVYEGLLDHTCTVASETTLGLLAKKSSKGNTEPEIGLSELEARLAEGRPVLEKWLSEEHKFNKTELKKLDNEPTELEQNRLTSACGNDHELAARIAPFFGIVRTDLRGLPQVFLTDSFVVTDSRERSDTGAHYTPKTIAEELIKHTLEPLVYEPGPHNEEDPNNWLLRPWVEIVDLKVLDPACGSGAMLVAACRFLSSRLVEAWQEQDAPAGVGLPLPGAEGAPLVLPSDEEEWTNAAMRLVADRCLYGVDINDMAVEMCKLSLWLATLSKGKPFSFLDHSIRHGDALLGITELQELEDLRLGETAKRRPIGAETVRRQVTYALELRRDLLGMPTVDARDIQEKARLFGRAQEELKTAWIIADALVGAYLSTAGARASDRDSRLTVLADDVREIFDGSTINADLLEEIRTRSIYWLDEGRPLMAPPRVPIHWPLAFPEVFLEGRKRFDATVSNPPFLGGQKLTLSFGSDYREYVAHIVGLGRKGSADLVAYFFLRGIELAVFVGYLATNTLSQGETSEVGLGQILASGKKIYRATSSAQWPGDASVEVSQAWITRRSWSARSVLDGIRVDHIDEMLYQASVLGWKKQKLDANKNQSFQGATILGLGFTLAPEQARKLIDKDPRNGDVLFPYMGGTDLNSSPTLTAPRWVINFHDWPEQRAREYPECFEIVERLVRPGRQKHLKKKYQISQRRGTLWWLYSADAAALYRSIEGLDRVLAICLVSKSVMPVFVQTNQVFSHVCGVFAYSDDFHFGLLSSGFHYRWACRYGSSLETRVRYTPTDVFETFAQPSFSTSVETAGKALDEHRTVRMVSANEGLTDTYNRVHNPDDVTPEIVRLRELHVDLDHAVRHAYGWDDLNLEHGFHPVRGQGVRFTFSPDVAVEVLYRQLELNRERSEAEVGDRLHNRTKARASQRSKQSESLFE